MERDPSGGTEDTIAAPPPEATTSEPPASLARYRLGGVIGRGGMGEVIAARDEQIGRSVAIKRLRARDAAPEVIARFLREARIQGRLEHPAIVPVHELHDTGGEPFFVMKQLAGKTLADVIAERPRSVLLRAFVDVCLAIELAHTRGVIHRDLKPANIMLGDFGEVYVLDWGIARVAGDDATHGSFADIDTIEGGATAAGQLLGTPGFMSPEQIRGEDIDARSDVYALGCVLFEILAGKPLHPRGQAALATTLAGIDARPSQAAPERDVPPELDAICATATATAREQRFASARALADAVQRYLDGDRDLGLRRDLAASELAAARAAIERNDRAGGLRAAARALALDPHAREAAELVGRLMLEPPAETPREVERELVEIDQRQLLGQARRGGLAVLGFLAFMPLLYGAGVREGWFIAVIAGLAVLVATSAWLIAPRRIRLHMVIAILANAAIVAAIARETTPILVAPGLAAVLAGLFTNNQQVRPAWAVYLLFLVAVLVPWGLELWGVLPETIGISGNAIVLHGPGAPLDATLLLPSFVVWIGALCALSVTLTHASARERMRMQRALQIQAWQLRQLVP